MKRVFGVLIGSWLLATSAQAVTMEKKIVSYSNVQVPTYIFLPDKVEGKIPAILMVHGSGGLGLAHKKSYAEKFAKLGIATIAIDTFTPRGVTNTISNQASVDPADMAKDALHVLGSLKDHSHIDAERVGVMGFSKGGIVVMDLSRMKQSQFALYIAMYPACNGIRLHPKTNGKPLVVLLGADDEYNNPKFCEEAVKQLKSNGSENIHLAVFPGAQHSWDVPGPVYRKSKGENAFNCRFLEIKPQVWIESKTKLVIFDHGRTKDRPKALEACLTHQVSWGYSAKVTRESSKLIESFVSLLKNKG